MKELLEKWAELEPERCNHATYQFEVFDGHDWIDDTAPNIQCATQQAIEARGWDWKMHSVDFKDGKPRTYFATAMYPRGQITMGSDTRQRPSPAEALLSAYLSALEAVKTQEVAG